MVKSKKGYNWKARQVCESNLKEVDSPSAEIIKIEIDVRPEQYDASNALVLPSKKQKSKTSKKVKPQPKPLSKKKRKLLEKVLEKKRKKVDRVELLEKLQVVQATPEELNQMTATHIMQTSGLKRCLLTEHKAPVCVKISNIKGINKRKNGFSPLQKSKRINLDAFLPCGDSSDSSSTDEEDNVDAHVETSNAPDTNISNNQCLEIEPDKVNIEKPTDEENNPKVSSTSETKPIVHEQVAKKVDKVLDVGAKVSEPAIYVPVERKPEIQAVREALPVYAEEQAIMEAIRENSVVVIHGATGTGKTTQVPQFLYEAGYTRNKKMIGITEPRRIAAVSMASRVAEEMNLPDAVSYHIRYERTFTEDKTEIKFMTDGVLLKEMRHDFLLSKYSAIIVDEAHERSVFSDVLIGLLSRIILLREKKGNPLKVLIMSATIRVEDFTENTNLFKCKPLLLQIESRQYDVVVHFALRTPTDYVDAAFKKARKIHRQLPAGAILIFLTGENEVTRLCKLLRKAFPFVKKNQIPPAKAEQKKPEHKSPEKKSECKSPEKKSVRKSPEKRPKIGKKPICESFCELAPAVDLDNYSILPLDVEGLQHQLSDDDMDDLDEEELALEKCEENFQPLHVLPLYSVLPTVEQAEIFKPPPEGSRLCVVATNVAETSITIPHLKYVVDSGKVKTRIYDQKSGGISNFVITWTSKASANQRAGRAGRTEGGHCYRLYSSAVFENDFPSFTLPDIQRTPVDDVLLQMKTMGIDRVVNFPFPSPPDLEGLKAAEKRLVALGALEDLQKGQKFKDIDKWEYSAKATPLGKAMSRFPVSPHFAKMLLLSYQHEVIPHIVALVSAMSVSEIFQASIVSVEDDENNEDDTETKRVFVGVKKIGAGKGKSFQLGDPMVFLRSIAGYEESKNKTNYCKKFGIRQKSMVEIHKMRLQLTKEMNRTFVDLDMPLDLEMEPPTVDQIDKLRKILASSLSHHVARKVPISQLGTEKRKLRNAYKCLDSEEFVFIHPSSILHQDAPDFVVYQEIFETSKFFMRTIIDIEPEWLAGFAPSLCEYSEPLETPTPYYDKKNEKILCTVTSTFGRWRWDLPCVNMEMPQGLTKYNWFCFFLLDGQICPFFKQYKTHLLSPPTIMLKSWARLQPRTRFLLEAVISREVDSKKALYKVWKTDSKYLLRQYSEWLPQEKHLELSCKWPPTS